MIGAISAAGGGGRRMRLGNLFRFNGFRRQRPSIKFFSRRQTTNNGGVIKSQLFREKLFQWHQQKNIIGTDLGINLITLIVLFSFIMAVIAVSNNFQVCNGKHLFVWLVVQTAFQFWKITLNLINLCSLKQSKSFFLFQVFTIYPFKIGWVVYGSIAVYTYQEAQGCNQTGYDFIRLLKALDFTAIIICYIRIAFQIIIYIVSIIKASKKSDSKPSAKKNPPKKMWFAEQPQDVLDTEAQLGPQTEQNLATEEELAQYRFEQDQRLIKIQNRLQQLGIRSKNNDQHPTQKQGATQMQELSLFKNQGQVIFEAGDENHPVLAQARSIYESKQNQKQQEQEQETTNQATNQKDDPANHTLNVILSDISEAQVIEHQLSQPHFGDDSLSGSKAQPQQQTQRTNRPMLKK